MVSPTKTRFLACRDCGLLHPVVAPSRATDEAAESELLDAYAEFIAAHAEHHTTCLQRMDSDCFADRPLWDPLATLTFALTDGQATYVATASRPSIEEPRLYRFAPGHIAVHAAAVDVDERDLQRALDAHFYPHVLRSTQLDRFLAMLHEVVHDIDPASLEIAFDDADDPAVSIARMPDASFELLLLRCAEIFDPIDYERVSRFLRYNRDEDGLLALRVRRQPAEFHA